MTEGTEAKETTCALFERWAKKALRNGGLWSYPTRREAIASFAALGFPTPKNEEWKYTSIDPILRIPFEPARYELDGLTVSRVREIAPGEWDGRTLVFVNGHYSADLSSVGRISVGVRAIGLAAAARENGSAIESCLARYASFRNHAFVALNTAFMEDGAFIHVPRGKVAEPIHLLFISNVREAAVSHPRNLIVLEPNSQAAVLESYIGLGRGAYFTNAVTEILLGEGAVVEHYKMEEESPEAFHMAVLQAHQERSSNFASHSIAMGGALVRNEVRAVLDGEGSECLLNGLYLTSGAQHVDNHTRIDHVKPHGLSRELYKGILDGNSRGIFNGKIVVHKFASKTDAKQTNRNLLLSEKALVNTKPQLEIFNNDVKCTHGSTVGQLEQEALFYLRSRGLGLETARRLLTYGFASEVVNRIRLESLRLRLERDLLTRF